MCGVAGIFAYHYAAPSVDREELVTIRDAMLNRGPDGFGEWFSKDGRAALGHRRLAIIDLTDGGAQPMQNQDGSIVISFNGEIYNYKELRLELEKKGYRFKSSSDTEVLLHLYADRGEAMVHDLRGMFAFILWDAKKKALWMVRDPYGIKPLYYANDGWSVRVASQVKALLKSTRVSKDPEPAGIVGFFLWGSVPEPFTTYQEIRSVPAGSYLWVDELGVSEAKQYFSVAQIFKGQVQAGTSGPVPNTMEKIRNALKDSLQHHFVSDVPVALFLSAGIDSGTLAALSYDLGFRNLTGITLAFDEFSGTAEDEVPLAKKIADQYGMKHIVSQITRKDFESELPKIFEVMDQPSIDGINTYFVSKAAKEAGFKVAISGLGGDELFGGYPSFRDVPKIYHWMKWMAWIPGLGDLFRLVCEGMMSLGISMHPKLVGLIKLGGTFSGAYFLKRGLFMPWELDRLETGPNKKDLSLSSDLIQRGLERLHLKGFLKHALNPDPKNDFARVSTLEATLYMKNQLLRDADWAGMAHSLEIRTPLVDSVLIKNIASFIVCSRQFQIKSFLASIPNLPIPSQIFQLTKVGFIDPFVLSQTEKAKKNWTQRRMAPSREKGMRIGTHFCLSGMKANYKPTFLSDKFSQQSQV